MEDKVIISYFLERNEDAIKFIQEKYGNYCFRIASNILVDSRDAEECVNDTWNVVWNSIPPIIPISLRAYLSRVTRNLAITRYRSYHSQKRNDNMVFLMDELEECITSTIRIDEETNLSLLTGLIDGWLKEQESNDRIMFLRRYYMCESLSNIAKHFNMTENRVAQKMHKLRKSLKNYLDGKGYSL